MVRIRRSYEMHAAHHLTAGVPAGHKCRRLHGHTYKLTIDIAGRADEAGLLLDFHALDVIVRPLILHVDHHHLNTLHERCTTIEASEVAANPTAERLCAWFVHRLRGIVASARLNDPLKLIRVEIAEDSRSSVIWGLEE